MIRPEAPLLGVVSMCASQIADIILEKAKRTHGATPFAMPKCERASEAQPFCTFAGDGLVTFVEDGHVYTAYGAPIDRSTTAVLGAFFVQFDGVGCTDEWYVESWKANPNNKYHARIHQVLGEGAVMTRQPRRRSGRRGARWGTRPRGSAPRCFSIASTI